MNLNQRTKQIEKYLDDFKSSPAYKQQQYQKHLAEALKGFYTEDVDTALQNLNDVMEQRHD